MSPKPNATHPARLGRRRLITAGVVAFAALVAVGLYVTFRSSDDGTPTTADAPAASHGSGKYIYAVGDPGPGARVMDFTLPSTKGGSLGTANFKGKTVLTYWHEGLGCQPCWDQIRAIEAKPDALKSAGIDEFLSITSGPVDALARKMRDDALDSVTLADTDLAVSRKYSMNQFGMMGDSRDGHSFLLIGPDGKIQWRADYGGSPNYHMFVPVDTLMSQLKAGRRSQ